MLGVFSLSAMMQHADPRGWWKDAITVKWERLGRGGQNAEPVASWAGQSAGGTAGSALLAPPISGVKGIKGVCESGCAGPRTWLAQICLAEMGGFWGRYFGG